MSSRRILQAIKAILFLIVVGTPLFYFKWGIYPYVLPKSIFFEILVELLAAFWLVLAFHDKRYRPRMTPFVWGMCAYLFFLTVTAFTGVDPLRSFFASYERTYGIFLIYHFAVFALIVSALVREIPWKKIWYASFAASGLTVILALLQLKITNLLLIEDVGSRPGSTFGNPTFLAGYLLFNVFVASYYLLSKSAVREKWFLFGVVALDIIGIFLSQTRGDILGLVVGAIALLILFAIHPPAFQSRFFRGRAIYVVLLIVLLVASGTAWITRNNALWAHVPGLDRLKDISLTGGSSDIAPRLIAFGAAWKGFLDKPLTGWGLENFNVVFSKYYDPHALEFGYAETDFDKPHSIPLEELVSGGVFLFAAYYFLLALFLWGAKKTKDRPFFQAMVALVLAYAVRSVVIFDTIGPVFLLYLLFGMSDGLAYHMGENIDPSARSKAIHPGWIVASVGAAVIFMSVFSFTTLYASYHDFLGHLELQIDGNVSGGISDFRADVDTWNPYQWGFIQDYANVIAQAYFYKAGGIPKEEVQYAISKMEEVADEHPSDAYNHYLLTDIYNLAYDIDPKSYLAKAEAQAAAALALSPNRQEIYFYLAKTKSLEGDNAAAFDLAKKAVDLDPKVPDSHFYYGMLAFATGKNAIGMNEVKTSIALGRVWRNVYEPRVAADFFADANDLPEAIDLYKVALQIQPGDLETEIKLGAASYLHGDREIAKMYLTDAAERFDFSESPAYGQYKPILDALGVPPHITGGAH